MGAWSDREQPGIPMEPSADLRTLANTLRQMYVALLAEDFTEQQALVILGQVLSASAGQ
jgi:hypothetical protein